MSVEDQFKLLIGAYYGVKHLDDYELKEYLLRDIRNMINDFIENNKDLYDYKKLEEKYEKELSKRTKYQNALIVLHNMNAPLEVILLIRNHLKKEK